MGWQERGRARQRERLKDPVYRAEVNARRAMRNKERRKTDPEYAARERKYQRDWRQRPSSQVKERHQRWKRRGRAPLRPETDHCEICGRKDVRRIVSEHDHKTKKWRGWACDKCNHYLAMLDTMRDDLAFTARLLAFQAQGGAPVPLKLQQEPKT